MSAATARRRSLAPARRRTGMALAAAVLGLFLITMDATIVNVALPTIQSDLGGGQAGLQWVVDGYTLPFAGLLLGAGALADRIGAKRSFGIGVAGFAAASAVCALAPSIGVLIAARIAQGAFAAAVAPASMALVRHTYDDPTRRARAVSLWAMGGGIAAVCGPLLGGVLTTVDWRLIFVVNIPFALATVVLLRAARPSPARRVPFDAVGQLTGLVAIGGLVFAVIEAGAQGLTAIPVLVAAGAAVVSACLFVRRQHRARHPMVPLSMFRSRTVVITVATGFTFMIGFFGQPFVFSIFLQHARGLDAFQTGLVFLPMMICGAALTPFVPLLVERAGPRVPIVGGQILMAASFVGLALVPADVPAWVLAVVMIPVGLTAGFINPPVSAVLLNHVDAHLAGVASGIYNTGRQVGGALAIAVFGILLSGPADLLPGMRACMVIAAALVLTTAGAGLGLRTSGSDIRPS